MKYQTCELSKINIDIKYLLPTSTVDPTSHPFLKNVKKTASLLFDIYHGVLKSGWSKFVQGVSVNWARQRCSSQLNKVKIFSQFLSSRFATSYSKYLSRTYVAKLHDQSLDKCWMYPVEPYLHLKTFASCVILISPFLWSNILQNFWMGDKSKGRNRPLSKHGISILLVML